MPFTGDSNSWFRLSVFIPVSPDNPNPYCSILVGHPSNYTPNSLGIPPLRVNRTPLALSLSPSHPFTLAQLYSCLPSTDLQKHSLSGNPQPKNEKGQQKPWNRTSIHKHKTINTLNLLNHSNPRYLDTSIKALLRTARTIHFGQNPVILLY